MAYDVVLRYAAFFTMALYRAAIAPGSLSSKMHLCIGCLDSTSASRDV